MQFYYIKSPHGDFFGFNKQNSALCLYNEQEEGRDFERIVGFTSDKFPDMIFLFPQKSKEEKFKLTQSSFKNNIYPFYLKETDNHYYHFINIDNLQYLSCIPCHFGWAADGRWHTGGMPYLWLEKYPHDWEKISLEALKEEDFLPHYQEFSFLIETYFTPQHSALSTQHSALSTQHSALLIRFFSPQSSKKIASLFSIFSFLFFLRKYSKNLLQNFFMTQIISQF